MMVTTVTLRTEPSADRTLCIPLPLDVPQGPLEVIVVITPLQPAPSVSNLAGRWQTYFPPDFDIDSALQEIRHEWEEEWMKVEA